MSHTQGGQTFLHREEDKHFMLEKVVAMMILMFMKRWMWANFLVSKATILVSEVSKLAEGARVYRGVYTLKFYLFNK